MGRIVLVFAALSTVPAYAELPTEPLKAVQSLHRIQDQIAGGDASAFAMQTQTLKVIDALFANMRLGALYEDDTLAALLTYAVSGGNPATFARAYTVLDEELEGRDKQVLENVAAAVLGRAVDPEAALSPRAIGGMLGGGVALLSAMRARDKPIQIQLLNDARLIAPGTLIEESALRRLVAVHAEKKAFDTVLRLSSRYARTFIRSPYASDFAGDLIPAAAAMTERSHHERLAQVIAFMPVEHKRSIVGRTMRTATVAGNFHLVRFLEARFAEEADALAAVGEAARPVAQGDPEAMRRRLFALMANIATTDHADVSRQLAAIDENRLAPADRQLLDAARAIASELTRPIDVAPRASASPAAAAASPPLPARDGAQPLQTMPDPLLPPGPVMQPPSPTLAGASQPAMTGLNPELDGFITQTRSVLDAVDAILEEAGP